MGESLWLLFFADTHVGSAFGLWPPGAKLSTGAPPTLNRGQEYLWRNWGAVERQVRDMTGGRVDVMCCVGDAVQGPGDDRKGEYVIENELAFQGKAFVELVQPLRDMSGQYYQFKGTKWHVGRETEEWCAEQLGAEPDDMGHACWTWLPSLLAGGASFDVAHHSSAVQVNQAMPLEREQRYAALVSDLKGDPKVEVVVRAHAHREVLVVVDGQMSIGLSPLQLQTEFARGSRVPNRYLSRWLGVCLCEVRPGDAGSVRHPVTPHFLHFKHPPLSRRTYEPGGDEPWHKRLWSRISA